MDTIFARYGIPSKITTNNGPLFNEKEFETYTKTLGIEWKTITPLWTQGNTVVELQEYLHPKDSGQINHIELNAFSYVSKEAIGAVIYLKSTDQHNRVFVSLLFAQSTVTRQF